MKNIKTTKLQREVALLILLAALGIAAGTYYAEHHMNQHPGMIRLHIIANSNSPEDQMIKLKVRNRIVQYMEGADSIEEARAYIDAHLEEIEEVSETVIDDNGGRYTASAQRKVTFIPEKSYEDLTLPAGNYEALKITLGEGKGRNWWCVIFPQLCLVGEDAEGEKLILKSKILELLKEKE